MVTFSSRGAVADQSTIADLLALVTDGGSPTGKSIERAPRAVVKEFIQALLAIAGQPDTPPNDDCDDIAETGVYRTNSSTTNGPGTGRLILHMEYTAETRAVQIAGSAAATSLRDLRWREKYGAGTWSAWTQILQAGSSATLLSASPVQPLTIGGTANAITVTTGASLASVPTGFRFCIIPTVTNTGAVTIAVDGETPVSAVTYGSRVALPAGYTRVGKMTQIHFDGTNYVVDREPETISNANGQAVLYADGRMKMRDKYLFPDWETDQAVEVTLPVVAAKRPIVSWTMPVFGAAAKQNAASIEGTASVDLDAFVVMMDGTGTNTATTDEKSIRVSVESTWYDDGALF